MHNVVKVTLIAKFGFKFVKLREPYGTNTDSVLIECFLPLYVQYTVPFMV